MKIIENNFSIFKRRSALYFAPYALYLLGDQITMIAMPWLMFRLTNNPMSIATLLSLIGIPRVVMILIGGFLADLLHPARTFAYALLLRLTALGAIAILTTRYQLEPTHLYIAAVVFGVSSAIAFPAQAALLTHAFQDEDLRSANSITLLAAQFSVLGGPIASGFIMQSFADAGHEASASTIIFTADSIASIFLLATLRYVFNFKHIANNLNLKSNLNHELHKSWRAIKKSKSLLPLLLYTSLIAAFMTGPFLVGMPALLKNGSRDQAISYGNYLATVNIGSIIALTVAPKLYNFFSSKLLATLLISDLLTGIAVTVFASSEGAYIRSLCLFSIGLITGNAQYALSVFIQTTIDKRYIGRFMSLVTLAFVGLGPLSASISGYALSFFTPKEMFQIVGASVMAIPTTILLACGIRSRAKKFLS